MAKRKGTYGKQITLRLPDQLFHQWSVEADAHGITISTLIRMRMSGIEMVTTARKAG